MVDRIIDSRGDRMFQKDYKVFGNLVVPLNPAFEALRVATLYDMLQEGCRHYPKNLPPTLIMLTSEADGTTRYIFPYVGRNTILFESHQVLHRQICTKDGVDKITIDEAEADRTAIGHFEPYQTHKLTPLQDKTVRKSDFSFRGLKKAWTDQTFGGQLDFEEVKLTHLGRTHPINPLLNIYVDGSLIKTHTAIWRNAVMGFLRDIIAITATPNLATSE